MQLDKTQVEICQRSTLELLDLSLKVLRAYILPVLLVSAIFMLPFILVDILVVMWMLDPDAYFLAEAVTSPERAANTRFASHLVALWIVQFPLASVPTSIVLGNLVFFQKLTLKQLITKLKSISRRLLFVMGFLRLGLVTLALEPFVNDRVAFDWSIELFILIILPASALLIRSAAPFPPEVLGLELCPLRSPDSQVVSYRERGKRIHGAMSGEHVARMLAGAFAASMICLMVISLQLSFTGILRGDWQWSNVTNFIGLPIALWVSGVFISVFRFLCYLDTRIRLEGWEVDLRMRAEAERLNPRQKISTGEATVEVESVPADDQTPDVTALGNPANAAVNVEATS